MESIAGQSSFLRASRCLALVGAALVGFSGCQGALEAIVIIPACWVEAKFAWNSGSCSPATGQELPDPDIGTLKTEAANGDLDAAYRLGLFYAGEKSPEAWLWYCRAANQEDARSQVELGDWHRYDVARTPSRKQFLLSISPDDRIAFMWYSLAEKNGSEGAAVKKSRIANTLSSSQLEEAEQMVRDWKPGDCLSAEDRPSAPQQEERKINWQIVEENRRKLEAQCAAQPERC